MAFPVDKLLLLEHLTYLYHVPPLKNILDYEGKLVWDILHDTDTSLLQPDQNYGCYINGFDWCNIFLAMKREPKLLATRIVATHIDREQGGGGGISIVLINEAEKEAIVAFRGTAPAEWADDFAGANVIATPQQENALKWYQRVYEELHLGNYFVTMIGHSKGGNKAKFITVLDDTVDRCVSFDGQGFSDKFFREYRDRIVQRQEIIENHNIDYDYVNILMNDIGKKFYYQGFDYGKGGLAESHCPNTFFCFKESGEYTMTINPNGQSPEMQEMDRFLNSYSRSIPTDEETTQSTQLMGELVERAFNMKHTGETVSDYLNFLCDMVSSDTYNDNVAFLLAFFIKYKRQNPDFLKNITKVLKYFDMEGFIKYINMLDSLLDFPGLHGMIVIADFLTDRFSDKTYLKLKKYLAQRFDVEMTKKQIAGMLSIVDLLHDSLDQIQIIDEGHDIVL